MRKCAGTNIKLLLCLVAFAALESRAIGAGSHPAGGELKITFYSQSKTKDGKFCEGKDDNISTGGDGFQKNAAKVGSPPKMVALAGKHNAKNCKITFKGGSWDGMTATVGDTNDSDTIDIAVDTSDAKDKKDCQKILKGQKENGSSQKYELTDCPGKKGGRGAAPRKPGAKARVKR